MKKKMIDSDILILKAMLENNDSFSAICDFFKETYTPGIIRQKSKFFGRHFIKRGGVWFEKVQ